MSRRPTDGRLPQLPNVPSDDAYLRGLHSLPLVPATLGPPYGLTFACNMESYPPRFPLTMIHASEGVRKWKLQFGAITVQKNFYFS